MDKIVVDGIEYVPSGSVNHDGYEHLVHHVNVLLAKLFDDDPDYFRDEVAPSVTGFGDHDGVVLPSSAEDHVVTMAVTVTVDVDVTSTLGYDATVEWLADVLERQWVGIDDPSPDEDDGVFAVSVTNNGNVHVEEA